jgi:hypothetical protein
VGSALIGKSAADKQAKSAKNTLKKQIAQVEPWRESGARAAGNHPLRPISRRFTDGQRQPSA